MSAREADDRERNDTDERNSNFSEKHLQLMRFNYENLDRAVWKAHQFSWFMTSIFVPVIFGGLGYLLKELDEISTVGVIMGATVVVGVTWFWYAITRILAGYNSRRFKQLVKLEEMFDKYYPPELVREENQFVQYRKLPGVRSKLRFKYAALGFAIFLSLVSASAAIAKMVLYLCEAMGVMI